MTAYVQLCDQENCRLCHFADKFRVTHTLMPDHIPRNKCSIPGTRITGGELFVDDDFVLHGLTQVATEHEFLLRFIKPEEDQVIQEPEVDMQSVVVKQEPVDDMPAPVLGVVPMAAVAPLADAIPAIPMDGSLRRRKHPLSRRIVDSDEVEPAPRRKRVLESDHSDECDEHVNTAIHVAPSVEDSEDDVPFTSRYKDAIDARRVKAGAALMAAAAGEPTNTGAAGESTKTHKAGEPTNTGAAGESTKTHKAGESTKTRRHRKSRKTHKESNGAAASSSEYESISYSDRSSEHDPDENFRPTKKLLKSTPSLAAAFEVTGEILDGGSTNGMVPRLTRQERHEKLAEARALKAQVLALEQYEKKKAASDARSAKH
jgi:hypothetical protein